MSRIRSVHPGLWTDEAFVCASPLARLLFIGIWNECDDRGSFEWAPLKLKMRLLPGDNTNVVDLLAELEANGCVRRYELGGRQLGAVRNFCKFQRPKKPNSVYPQDDDVRDWCGSADASSEAGSAPVENQFPTSSEISPQMEDGGGRMEDGERKKEGGRGKRAPAAGYAFTGRTIRLSLSDFQAWRKAYHAIPDLEAELTSLDAWLQANPAKQASWFHTVSGALNRKHQETLSLARDRPAQPAVPL